MKSKKEIDRPDGLKTSPPDAPDAVGKIKTELTKYRALAEENLRGWQRARADYQNLVKQTAQEKEAWITSVNDQLILEILPVLDNFHHALKHLTAEQAEQDWVKGILFIKTQLENVLSAQGVQPIKSLHQKFDPHYHEAVERVNGPKEAKDKIVEEMQKGYCRKGRVIRAARVKVGG